MIKRFGDWVIVGKYWVNEKTGQRIPVIQGAGPAVTVQNDRYAFGDDDGSESGHSLDTQNTNRTAQAPDVTFLIRIEVQETNGGTENLAAALYAQKNGTGGFTAVPFSATNNGLRLANDTQSRADDENTSNRLTGGSGTFTAGKYDDGTSTVGTSAVTLDNDTAGRTEFEFAIQIDSANASDSDYWELRVEQSGGTDLDGYPGSYPTVTASIEATDPQPSVSDGIATLADSATPAIINLGDVTTSDGTSALGDTPTMELKIDVIEADGIATLADSATVETDALEVNTTDGLTIADSLPGYYFDNITLGEIVTVAVGEETGDRNVSVSDTIQAQESITLALSDLGKAQSEGVTLGEAASAALADLESAHSDDITLDESSTLLIGLETNQSEGVTIGEADDENIGIATSHADNITLDESSTLLIGLETIQAEGVTIADAATLATDAMLVNVSDNISTVEDSASVEIGALVPQDVSAADNVTIADAVTLYIGLETAQAEGVTLGETDAENMELDASVTDGMTTADSASASVTTIVDVSLTVSDNIGIADVASIESADLYAALSENLTIGENQSFAVALDLSASDGVTLAESNDEDISLAIAADDNLTLGESAGISISAQSSMDVSVSDGIILADVLFASLPESLLLATSDNANIADVITAGILLDSNEITGSIYGPSSSASVQSAKTGTVISNDFGTIVGS